MRYAALSLLACLLLTVTARGVEIPAELQKVLPKEAEELVGEDYSVEGFFAAVAALPERLAEQGKKLVKAQGRGAASVLLVAVFCAAMSCWESPVLPIAGGLAVTVLSAESLEKFIALGQETITALNTFAEVLLPTLAAAAAVSGRAMTASMQQVTAMFLVSMLTGLICDVLLPATCLYIGVLTAGHCLQEPRLGAVAGGMKKIITWVLTTTVFLVTLYLSVARVLTGGADAAAIKLTKSAISGAVPVVGSIVADAAETVLAGTAMLKNTVGIFGVLGVLGLCALPFLQLGIQYLLYKGASFLVSAMGVDWLSKLIDGLGGAFGLILGMAGSCAVLVLISILCFLGVVSG